jgi:hypothetical protein
LVNLILNVNYTEVSVAALISLFKRAIWRKTGGYSDAEACSSAGLTSYQLVGRIIAYQGNDG